MKTKLLILLIGFAVVGCHNENNSDHNRTMEICVGIYVEDYTTFEMGAGGGSMLGHCLTDSVTFRVFVGTFDEGFEGILYHCQSDSLLVEFYSDDIEIGEFHEDNASYYSIGGLKLLNNYTNDPFFRFKDLEKLATTKAKLP